MNQKGEKIPNQNEIDLFAYNLVKEFMIKYPEYILKMNETEHNSAFMNIYSDWHIEGSVWTHTMMVLSSMKEQCKKSKNWKHLLIAALLHDIGKCYVRFIDQEKQKVRFFGHAGVSVFYARTIIPSLIPEFSELDLIYCLKLINYHDIMFNIRDESSDEIINKLSQKFNSKFGKILFNDIDLHRMADTTGHISCFTANHSPKIQDVKNKLTDSKKYKPDNKKPEAIIMMGLPGCGKSTYIVNNYPFHTTVSRDAQIHKLEPNMSYNEAWNKVDQNKVNEMFEKELSEAIERKDDIVIDQTNLTHKGRMKFFNRLKRHYNVKIVCLMPDIDVNFERNTQREGKVIHSEVILKMMKSFEMPFENEPEQEYIFNY